MKMPPLIVATKKPVVIQRKIEATRPVVQERIVENPIIVKKQVPKIITKRVPCIVPKYTEKIVEVPFRPGMSLPPPQGHIASPDEHQCPEDGFEEMPRSPNGYPPSGFERAGSPATSHAIQSQGLSPGFAATPGVRN